MPERHWDSFGSPILESKPVWKTLMPLHWLLLMQVTCDSVDFHWTVCFKLLAPFCPSHLQRLPSRHGGEVAEGSVRVTLRFIQSSWVSIMKKRLEATAKMKPGPSSASKLWTEFNQLRWFKRYQRRSQGLLVCDTACETQAKTEADWDFIATRNISLIGS